jgi:hypothetical protein
MKLECSEQIFKNTLASNSMEISAVGAELFHAGGQTDGQTDMNRLIVSFRNLALAPKNVCSYRTNSNSISLSLWALCRPMLK